MFLLDDVLDITVQLQSLQAILRLSKDMKLFDIIVDSNGHEQTISDVSISNIIKDSVRLTSPQDIRYAVFALTAAQTSKKMIASDVSEQRKTYLVDILSSGNSSTDDSNQMTSGTNVRITMLSGVSIVVNLHECYPQVFIYSSLSGK